jgi:uroporphyrinogen decarboxylase
MVEGGSSREFLNIKTLAKEEPNTLDLLMNVIAETTIEYLNGQIDAGVQAIQIFDTWGAILDDDDFRRFSMQSMQKIIDGLIREKDGQRIPIIVFTKGAGSLLSDLADIGCDTLGVDWSIDLDTARKYVKDKVALQGNLNPKTLLASPENIRQGVIDTLTSYGVGPGHVFNLGHGITPDVKPENLAVLVDAVHEFSPSFHD